MPGALAMILVAVAVFTTLVVSRRGPSTLADSALDVEQVKGFVYVGAAALALLAVVVLVLSLAGAKSGRAESLAVLGFFGYVLYLLTAVGVLLATAHRERRRATRLVLSSDGGRPLGESLNG